MRATLKAYDGPCFLVVEPSGDIAKGRELGLYYEDTRFLSLAALTIDDKQPILLAAYAESPSHLVHYLTSPVLPQLPHGSLLLRRSHLVSRGMHADLDIRNHGEGRVRFVLRLDFDADFADVFEIKRLAELATPYEPKETESAVPFRSVLALAHAEAGWRRRTEIRFSQRPTFEGRSALFTIELDRGETFHLCQDVYTIAASDFVPPRRCTSLLVESPDDIVASAHRPGPTPHLFTDYAPLDEGFAQAIDDLYALRIRHLDGSRDAFHLAAGAPWYMALFGRDSLIAATQAIAVLPELSRGVLLSLARWQGRVFDPETEEEPGKILHEHRSPNLFGARGFVPRFPYYGTVDATPLFVRLLSEAFERNGDIDFLRRLEPNLFSAIGWLRNKLRDGPHGFLTYRRSTSWGLENQGWKGSHDAIRFRDGTLAEPPIALVEVQGYAVDALRRAAKLYRALGRSERLSEELLREAGLLEERIDRELWLEDRDTYALAKDGKNRLVDSLTSNAAHLLWSEAVPRVRAERMADTLLSPELFSGFGLRTMGTSEGGYNPVSYHNGSVWPHDTSIAIAGLARYGLHRQATRLASALLSALAHYEDRRLPELFAGLSREEASRPIEYATSNSPQAWAAGAVLLVTQVALGLTISVPDKRIEVAPILPEQIRYMRLTGLDVEGHPVTIEVRKEGEEVVAEVQGAPPEYRVVTPHGEKPF